MTFFFTFGDGATVSGGCIQSHTYPASTSRDVVAAGKARKLDTSYNFEGCAVDPFGASQCRARTVTINAPAPSCKPPTIGTLSAVGAASDKIDVSVSATDSGRVHFSAEFLGFACSYTATPDPLADKDVTGSGPTYSATLTVSNSNQCYKVHATAFSSCSTASATATPVIVDLSSFGAAPPGSLSRGLAPWSSDLAVQGGRLQVVVNGASASFPATGRAYGVASLADGENRVEAVLVESKGKAGLWRFDLMNSQAIAPGSIRVIAGDVVSIAATSVTFRLRGESGERIVFTFQKQ